MLTAKIQDLSGSVFICFPKELGNPIMNGMAAEEFKNFKDNELNNYGTPEEKEEALKEFFYQT